MICKECNTDYKDLKWGFYVDHATRYGNSNYMMQPCKMCISKSRAAAYKLKKNTT